MDYYGFTLKELGLKHTEDIDGFLGSIIQDGFYEKLVIIGFPYDQIIKQLDRKELKIGCQYGPDSWRRFIHTCGTTDNREFAIKIDSIKIADYGNIVAHKTAAEFNLLENQQKLFIKCLLTFERNQVNFVMGGTRDFTPYVSKALISHKFYTDSASEANMEIDKKYNKCWIISLTPKVDNEPVIEGQLTPFNRHTYLTEMAEFIESGSELLIIGTVEEHKEMNSENTTIILKSQVEQADVEKVAEFNVPIMTKLGRYFYYLLKDKRETYQCIQVEIDIMGKTFDFLMLVR